MYPYLSANDLLLYIILYNILSVIYINIDGTSNEQIL